MDDGILTLSELPVNGPVTRSPVLFSTAEAELYNSSGSILFVSLRNDNATGVQKISLTDGPALNETVIIRMAIPAGTSKEIYLGTCGIPFFNSLHIAGMAANIFGSVTFRVNPPEG